MRMLQKFEDAGAFYSKEKQDRTQAIRANTPDSETPAASFLQRHWRKSPSDAGAPPRLLG